MDITNISSETYVFIGGRPLAPANTLHFEDAEYGDEELRNEINALYNSGKISVANAPTGFPIEESENGDSQTIATDGIVTVNPLSTLRLPAGTLTDLGSGEAGVAIQTKLLGPFSIDAGVDFWNSINIFPFSQGDILLRVLVVITETWVGSGGISFYVGEFNGGPGASVWTAAVNPNATGVPETATNSDSDSDTLRVVFPGDGDSLYGFSNNQASSGSLNIYALIANAS